MSTKSNDQGRAYEYGCLISLEERISAVRPVQIEKNSSYTAALHAWNSIESTLQATLTRSASAAVDAILELEPLILEDGTDMLELKIQADSQGVVGDVRDILIIRRNIKWEIGLSVKHNHFAVKHSRLSKNLDFGNSWFGVPCSTQYWSDIAPIFTRLDCEKKNKVNWSDLTDKEETVYIPLLRAFINELNRSNNSHPDIPKKMVAYLLGEFDFYKVISIDNEFTTRIQGFNMHGDLNKSSKHKKSTVSVPVTSLPTRIVVLSMKPDSNNTIELYMDGGWQFSFRIHNASTKVEPSLKFDIQIVGMPTTIITINCTWH